MKERLLALEKRVAKAGILLSTGPRNGHSGKTVRSESGPTELSIQDRGLPILWRQRELAIEKLEWLRRVAACAPDAFASLHTRSKCLGQLAPSRFHLFSSLRRSRNQPRSAKRQVQCHGSSEGVGRAQVETRGSEESC